MTSLKKLAYRGAVWTILGYGMSQVARFGGNLILTRLLVPEFFGLMAIVNTLRMGIELFSDIGISQSIVSSKRGDEPDFLDTAWTLQIIRGWIIWLFCLILAFPVASFYEEERLLWLIPIVGLSSVLDGFSSSSILTLMRNLDLRKSTLFELSVQVFTLVCLIGWTSFNPSIWALTFGLLLGAIYKMVGSHFLISGYRNRFAWDKDAVKEILSFGKWMFMSSALMFLSEQSDRLILGKLLSFSLLGVYTIAYTLASLPSQVIKQLSYKVIFPAISNQTELPRSILREKIISQRRLLLLGCAVVLAALVTVGDLLIGTLYDDRYAQAIWMMPILCGGIWFSLLFYTISPALLAIGKPLYLAQSNFARFVTIGFGLPVAYYKFGLIGAIVTIALSDLPLYFVNLYGLWRERLSCITQDIQTTIFYIAVLALFLYIRYFLGFGIPIQKII
ncbi:MAG: oligosaccharide flippase family protein [Richelia sp. RM2_1_2]|nr:oligosaccharide flippase family protein [Richelia sp. SM2_1_7]NJM21653.1 oligosaccharide flippase family protein [Richelia sp. SM1_7_0]NJN09659.1 oligosaccharide flippase family protein [Richelia sp. RM1_1_1]NJO27967.1 oligosaccharide flippase family protein [Richelia sp. SL_2_1]NJO57233.1 oligosaccharide flippase family protein [Richelia sp. RM2_1_2]